VSLNTVSANAAIFAILSDANGGGTPGSGYTGETVADITWYDSGEYDIDAGGAGAKTVDFTLGGSALWVINAIAIKPAAEEPPAETLMGQQCL
jgi:hypothetical protein